jgi:LysM repeat protein
VRIVRKPRRAAPKGRLRASAHRAASKYSDDDYAADEPNVKLSRAFVVVLLLHVVAVGGIFAFSALKDRQSAAVVRKGDAAGETSSPAQTNAGGEQGMPAKGGLKPVSSEAQKLVDSSRTSGGATGKLQTASTRSEGNTESARVYVVQRGDSPAGIAKKFKVSYANLLKTNNIEDPKKLQIGQKLLIP